MMGCIGEDSANVKHGIEHDHVTNTIIGGGESHKTGTLSQMFHAIAQKVKDTTAEDVNENDNVMPQIKELILD